VFEQPLHSPSHPLRMTMRASCLPYTSCKTFSTRMPLLLMNSLYDLVFLTRLLHWQDKLREKRRRRKRRREKARKLLMKNPLRSRTWSWKMPRTLLFSHPTSGGTGPLCALGTVSTCGMSFVLLNSQMSAMGGSGIS